MGVEAVIATQVMDTTTVGRSLMTAADAAAARTAISFDESVDDRVSALLAAGTNITITYNDAANTLTIASTAGGLSGTGSVDNAALRADGTGGATLQNSAWVIADNATASPNNTVNHASIQATGSTTNVSVSIVPKGTGAFCLQVPDGTSAGGNARGANSVDFQMVRSSAAQVASSDYSFVVGNSNQLSTASWQTCVGSTNQLLNGNYQTVFGAGNILSSSNHSIVVGNANTVSAVSFASVFGDRNDVSATYGSCRGIFASAYLPNMRSVANDGYAAKGDSQLIELTDKLKTTSATSASWAIAIPTGKMWTVTITAGGIKSDGSATAGYIRKVTAKNVAGTVTVVSSTTVGTDNEDNAATDFAVTASGANMLVTVTGIAAEVWRWHIAIFGVDIKYGT